MCLINFQFQKHPKYKLVVAANRDEFYGRPTESAHFWEDTPSILAGRDLEQGGTWLGVDKTGKFAALTNFRDPSKPEAGKISRGALVRDYLAGTQSPTDFLAAINPTDYTGFNLLVGDADRLFYYNNIQPAVTEIAPGTYGLSNHLLDTPWPKVIKGKKYLYDYLSSHEEVELDSLFNILANSEQASDSELPRTGIGLEFERKLSAMFIKTPDYGTRSASVVLVDYDGTITFAEKTFKNGEQNDEQIFNFKVK
ncbi:NRDE family protein [Planomicrobium sp. CPCC 101079]|uniref:NRDE family protein n=1 Tax=Planomicrobium sp. CPCC 101079 TaxID=2599618 RepID=UPI0011B536E2|nr:NRDE family protein [Planomicrobium sp. CPCC 101079]TWT04952.1 NRDE family protein [Planomicrobium sp. CPCC 101079]